MTFIIKFYCIKFVQLLHKIINFKYYDTNISSLLHFQVRQCHTSVLHFNIVNLNKIRIND